MQRPHRILFFTALAILVMIAYGRFLDQGFFRDDFTWLENAALAQANPLHIFTLDIVNFFRPLAHLAMLMQFSVFGLDSTGYHAVSLLLHLINAILFFYFLRDVLNLKNPFILIATPILWATHFLHFEAVAWIASQSTLLATTFSFLTFLGLRQKRPGLALMAFILALLSKEEAIILFPALVWHQWVFTDNRLRDLFKSKWMLTFAVICGIYFVMEVWTQRNAPLVELDIFKIQWSAFITLMERILMLLLDLQVPVQMVMGTLLLVVFYLLSLAFSRETPHRKPLIFWLGFLVLALGPTLFIQTPVPSSRYFYLPSLAATSLIILIAFQWVEQKGWRQTASHIFVGALVVSHLTLFGQAKAVFQEVVDRERAFIEQLEPHAATYQGQKLNFINSPVELAHLYSIMKLYFDIPRENIFYNQLKANDTITLEW